MKPAALFTLLTSLFFFLSCGSDVTLTTPKQDGAKCERILRDCNNLNEVQDAIKTISKYYEAYEKALYSGKITGEQYKEFLMNAPNDAEIDSICAYVVEFGHGPNNK
ncbi:MAG: hypothetical protein J5965_14370 [Aeriscardovia sp.]|nr:hypothetical protein [Aeriscardovia sp.]